jgi:sugar porter (SP) family MFS transporter
LKNPGFNTAYIFRISMISALGGFLFGYDWVVIGGAKFFYERFFDLVHTPHLQGLAMSSALLGCIPGALFAGYLSDKFGRKPTLIWAAVLFTLSALGTGFASGFSTFMIFRILGGMGIGLASCISPIYIAEVSPRNMRGRFVSLNQFNIVIGILAAQLANFLIAREVPTGSTDEYILNSWNGQTAWRWMFWAEIFPAGMFFVLAFFLPESPRWMIKMKREESAGRTLERIGGKEYARQVADEIRQSFSEVSRKINFAGLRNRKIRPILIVGMVLAAFQQWCGINIVFNYAEEVFTSAGFGISDALLNIVITGAVNLVFTLLAMRVVDGWGRRKLMLFGSLGLAVTYLFLGAAFHMEWNGFLVLSIIVVALAVYAMSLAPITWVVLSEIFPNRVRGAAMAVATTTLWVASALLVLLFPLIRHWIQISGAFWLYALICVAGFLFIRSRLPETKGRSLEEIEEVFKKKRQR